MAGDARHPARPGGGALRDAVVAAGYQAAWRVVRHAPEAVAYRTGRAIADRIVTRGGRGVDRLRANLARAVPAPDLDEAVRQGMRSYVRYWVDAFRLPSWSPSRIVDTVRISGVAPLAGSLASGRGAVGALAHLGNWDHAGAWAALNLAPVTSVAERVRPEAVFRRFLAYRARLGIEILPLTGGRPPMAAVADRLRRGAFVPLLSDRDLTGRGVEVDLLGEAARVAAGPAVLAARTGAALHPVTIHYEPLAASPSGWGLVVDVHPEISPGGGDPDGVRRTVQACADVWSAAIRRHPQDWHMLQRVFVADLSPAFPGT